MRIKNKIPLLTAIRQEDLSKYNKINIFFKINICQEENSYGGKYA